MNDRIRHVDGLRGVAVLAVVLYHCAVHDAALTSGPQTTLSFLLRQACHGVDLFFVLSGFCLSYPVLARLYAADHSSFNIPGYAARRVLRILPPYYAAIAVFAALGAALIALHLPLPEPMAREALAPAEIIKQALFLDHDRHFLDASFWTLSIEFRWYFIFPVLLWLWIRYRRAFAALALAAFLAQATRIDNVDVFFLPFFMLGIVAAELQVRSIRLPLWSYAALPLSLAIAALSTAKGGWYFSDSGPFWGVAMFCVVVSVGATPALRRWASSKWIVALGVCSYGVYLIHEPAVALIENLAASRMSASGAYVLAVAGAIAIGMVFSFIAERPFQRSRLRDRILANIEPSIASLLGRLEVPGVVDFHRGVPQQREELVA